MGHALEVIVLVSDLRVALAINKTSDPFITSDNPVVCYNQFMESRMVPGSGTGLLCKGLQMIVPMSPRHCVIYHDSEVYNVGNRKNPVFAVNRSNDVLSLNRLQAINAQENIFCSGAVSEDYLKRVVEDAIPFRRASMAETREYVSKEAPNRYLYVHSRCDIKCGLQLSFVSVLRGAQEWSPGNRAVHVRDEEMSRLFHEYCVAVKDHKYPQFMFTKYLWDIGYYGPSGSGR
jgi:hypothetical protein